MEAVDLCHTIQASLVHGVHNFNVLKHTHVMTLKRKSAARNGGHLRNGIRQKCCSPRTALRVSVFFAHIYATIQHYAHTTAYVLTS
eukprot:99193-Amphidinium_carterae.1